MILFCTVQKRLFIIRNGEKHRKGKNQTERRQDQEKEKIRIAYAEKDYGRNQTNRQGYGKDSKQNNMIPYPYRYAAVSAFEFQLHRDSFPDGWLASEVITNPKSQC